MRYEAFEYDLFQGVRIIKYHGSGNVVIPSKIKGSYVKHIGKRAFSDCKYLTEIIIPDTVISIGELAFSSCSSLKTVIIPDSVTSIGYKAFDFCKALSNIYCSKKLMDSYYSYNFLDSYKSKIHYYNVPSSSFSKIKGLSTSEFIRLIEQAENFLNKINHYIKNLPNISSELLEALEQMNHLLTSEDYTIKMNSSVANILSNIEIEYNRQNKTKTNAVLPTELSRKVNSLENAPSISSKLLVLIKQIKDLGAKDYPPELNDSVAKILANIESEYNRQQEKNPVISLITLVESVSSKQITNAPQYVQRFNDEVADFVSKSNAELEALRTEKGVIQNSLIEQKRENENRIRAAIETLKASLKV